MSVDVAGSAVGFTGVTVGVYVAEAFVPFMSSRTTVTAGAVPTNDFSGTKVTTPVVLSTVKVPITLPSCDLASTEAAG